MRRSVLALALSFAAFTAAPALADSASGVVVAFDRVAQIIVLDDKTIWSLADLGTTAPEGLEAGMKVTIEYEALGEDGYGSVQSITIAE